MLEHLKPADSRRLYHQIADHLGISHAAVEARLHRARAKLRHELTALNVIEAR